MKQLLRSTIQRMRHALTAAGYSVNKVEAFAYPDQAELLRAQTVRYVFDVGAKVGSVASRYRKQFPGATVHCFEVIPVFCAALDRLAAADPDIRVHRVAISDGVGKSQFNINEGADTSSLLNASLASLPASHRKSLNPERTISVDVTTIDQFCTHHAIPRIDVLKMDIQGGEMAALRGAERMLAEARIDLIYSEVWFLPFYENQALLGEMCRHLARFGYTLHNIYNVSFSGTTGRATWADAIFLGPHLTSRGLEQLKSKHGA